MMQNLARNALAQYNQIGVQSGVAEASPHRLIQMLLEGALARIAAALGHMRRGEIAPKGQQISLAMAIIDGLRAALNRDADQELVANLERLYDYLIRRLLEANLKNDPAILQEIGSLLSQIKQGWDAIGPAQAVIASGSSRKEDKTAASA
jgi:flagellar protein FliS